MTQRNYEEECGDYGGNEGECGLAAGWGTDFTDGKCKHHRGTSPDGTSHDGNGNALKHGATADPLNLYDNLGDDDRAWVDGKIEAYLDREGIAEDAPAADLVKLGVMHLYQAYRAHGELASEGLSRTSIVGTTDEGQPITDDEAHYLNKVASGHTKDFRMAIKDAGALDDPESQQAEAMGSLAEVLSE